MRFGEGYPERGLWCQRAAVLVAPGIGKSEAAIAEIIAQQARNHQYRIAYVVPEHKLADDVCRRFNRAAHVRSPRFGAGLANRIRSIPVSRCAAAQQTAIWCNLPAEK